MEHKRFFLERVVKENPNTKILVFVRTKVRAERVSKAMTRAEIPSITIHGDKDQETRTAMLDKFRNGEVPLLIATDITARGIDIPNVEIVVNYDLPVEAENYVHRVGRTGRANQKGHAYSFCAKEERPVLKEIQSYLQKEIKVLRVEGGEYTDTLDVEKERKNDYKALIQEDEEFEKKKKRKNRKK